MAEETKIKIPNFSYPFKLKIEEEYYTALSSVISGNYLFNDKGMWHGGIHFADQALTTVDSSKGIKAIADGELVAYRINDKYLQNSDEENEDEGLYSNGFFLIRHKIEYASSKLTFFSLYMHTAKKEDYYTHKIIGNPEYLRKTINGGELHSLNSVAKDKRIVLDTKWTKRRAKVLYLEDAIINETEPAYVHKSNIEVINEQESFSNISTILSGTMNSVVTLATPIKVKSGEIIGLVGEYNIPTKKDNKLLHLEVFTSDDVKTFASSAKNTFNTDTNENKLKPNKLKIPKGKTIYNLSKKLFEDSNTKQLKDKVLNISDVKKLKDKDDKEYVLLDDIKAVLLSDCEQTHGITFDWARIFEDINGDKVSIFENLEAVMNPTFYDKISGNVDEGIKLNSNFKELFEAIESDDEDNIIDAQELANASLDKEIKELTSKYIVKHSSEWDKVVSSPSYIETMIQSFKEKLGNVEGIAKHLENEKIRVDKLSFFTECSIIEGFPQSDEVYHFNPIGLIGEFKTSNCYCNRDFTVDEVKEIVKDLRDSESFLKGEYDLFTIKTNILNSDKTYEKFTEELNKTFNKYDINTCLRKIHFLAQIYHETNRFRSTEEEGASSYLAGKNYYPFYGRGLMQLTWKGNSGSGHTGYKQYFDYLNRTDYLTNYDEVGSDIELVFDSAGWFWEQGKTLSSSTPGTWNAPSFAGIVGTAVGNEQASSEKQILSYGSNPQIYGTLNLNLLADNDWIDTISWLVNGGGNGFQERRNYLKDIKGIMDYENCINKN
jgi:hypothetical protein